MEFIKVSQDHAPHVALIELNRPKELNALNLQLLTELAEALQDLDTNEQVRAIILTGNERAFAAGADIRQLADKNSIDMYKMDLFSLWRKISSVKKPIIAAVSGFALGGGCELAMGCDMIVASETAQFGQPEIKIGVIPGAGGTQRLTKAIGKVKAMELILTGRFIDAEEALSLGLVNSIVPVEVYMKEATKLAQEIASMPPLAVQMAKESINRSFEVSLEEGLYFERKNYNTLYSSEDQKEGMNAFIEKRKPNFKGQ
ncbi:enoyl-CoA hydratase-related protein [uncultured Roseivirga sp.]|jgi:enoyl-CoA hydratase|uniref:enoyl-CoA hydratase-related protein n=1 Tax=uncultured Roseivirga sp. TaxID=543088 RepID=UPI000D7B2F44|nr:enoyl-CoA hydratase-related protein [uncultured Roseivirga sp.]PWL27875.1 MAG: enoyl-CoA hydratase [Roseivirga sp. XM-24bin3]